jgi:hypothetical protein
MQLPINGPLPNKSVRRYPMEYMFTSNVGNSVRAAILALVNKDREWKRTSLEK